MTGKIFSRIRQKIDRLLLILFSTAGGLLFAQFPQFLAQYLQRLGGHIDEAIYIATNYHLTEVAQRAASLANGFQAIENANLWYKLPSFIMNAQWDIAREAYYHFTPGMTFNQIELYYLGAGCLIGWMIYSLFKGIFVLLLRLLNWLRSRVKKAPQKIGEEISK